MRKRFSKAQLLHFTANLEVELSSLVNRPGDNVNGCNSSKEHGTVWQHAPSLQR
jgi:hypothetical protein